MVKKGTCEAIEDLNRIAWQGRPAAIVPDSDTWAEPDIEKQTHCQHAMYALGKELERRGAEVTFLVLPQEGEEKVGLDDFLVRHSKADLASLPILTLNDESLSRHQAWYGGWKQRKEEEQASKQDRKPIQIETLADLS